MILRLSALLIAVLIAGSAGPARASETPRTKDLAAELTQLEMQRQEAYVRGDQAVLQSQFAAEYTHTNLRGGLTNREEELAFYKPGAFSLEDGAISDVIVHDYGAVAVLLGVIDWRGATYHPQPEVTVDLSGRFRVTRVYVFRDGRWQLTTSHASKMP